VSSVELERPEKIAKISGLKISSFALIAIKRERKTNIVWSVSVSGLMM
jgi:hypothetical protein